MTEIVTIVASLAPPIAIVAYFSKKVLGKLDSFTTAIAELQAGSKVVSEFILKASSVSDTVITHAEKISVIEARLGHVERNIKKIESFTRDCDTGDIKAMVTRVEDTEKKISGIEGKVGAILAILTKGEK